MKRIYITAVPLQSNFIVEEKPVNPINFSLDCGISHARFPIVPVIAGSADPEDDVKVLAIQQKNHEKNANREYLQSELESLHLKNISVNDIEMPEAQDKDVLLELFRRIILAAEDDACYYACMTFGTKTYPVVLFSALSYINKIKKNVTIKGIYYGEIRRERGQYKDAGLYDVSSLFALNELVDKLAAMDGSHSEKIIMGLLED